MEMKRGNEIVIAGVVVGIIAIITAALFFNSSTPSKRLEPVQSQHQQVLVQQEPAPQEPSPLERAQKEQEDRNARAKEEADTHETLRLVQKAYTNVDMICLDDENGQYVMHFVKTGNDSFNGWYLLPNKNDLYTHLGNGALLYVYPSDGDFVAVSGVSTEQLPCVH